MLDASVNELESVQDPLVADQRYHRAVVNCNQRITADDWFQDVRHIEFKFQDNLQCVQVTSWVWCPVATSVFRYEPGDVAVIHPQAASVDVESFLSSIGWGNIADDPLTIEPRFSGISLRQS